MTVKRNEVLHSTCSRISGERLGSPWSFKKWLAWRGRNGSVSSDRGKSPKGSQQWSEQVCANTHSRYVDRSVEEVLSHPGRDTILLLQKLLKL